MVGVFVVCDVNDGVDVQFELCVFIVGEVVLEDLVIGSFNVGIVWWLLWEGSLFDWYVISQGMVLGWVGWVQVEWVGEIVWIGGVCVICIEGLVMLQVVWG